MGLIESVVFSMATMAIACFLGVFTANVLLEFGLAKLISRPLVPLMRFANLPEAFSMPAIVSIIDIRSGLSVVKHLLDRSKVDDSMVIAYKLTTRPFSATHMLIRYNLPVSIAALGPFVGSIYVALSFASTVICMLMGIVYGKLKIKTRSEEVKLDLARCTKNKGDVVKSSLKSALDVTKKVVCRYAIITTVITSLLFFGFFDFVSNNVDAYIKQVGLSSDFATLISINIFSPTSAMLTAGEFLRNELLSVKECLTALFVGRLLFLTIMDYPRHAFPFYASILPAKLASKLVVVGLTVDALSTPLLIALINLML